MKIIVITSVNGYELGILRPESIARSSLRHAPLVVIEE